MYENPGHHDPRKPGRVPYNRNKSVLPENHEDLWNKSKPDPRDPNRIRWTKEGDKNPTYHRFQNDSNGNWHWNGSTDGRTAGGQPRKICAVIFCVMHRKAAFKIVVKEREDDGVELVAFDHLLKEAGMPVDRA